MADETNPPPFPYAPAAESLAFAILWLAKNDPGMALWNTKVALDQLEILAPVDTPVDKRR